MRVLGFFVIILVSLIVSEETYGKGSESCVPQIENISFSGFSQYRPFDRNHPESRLTVRLGREGACGGRLLLASTGRGHLAGREGRIRYEVLARGSVFVPISGLVDVPLPKLLRGAGNTALAMAVRVPAGQVMNAGLYSDDLEIQLIKDEAILERRDIKLAIQVASQARIRLAGRRSAGFVGGPVSGLNFGILKAGLERSAYLFAEANSPYALEIRSFHRSRLKHSTDSGPRGKIDYQAWLDGQALDLKGVASIYASRRSRAAAGEAHAFRVRIGETSGKLAGQYRDTVTFDIVLLE